MSAGGAPSFSDTWNPGSYTTSSSSTTNAPTRPVSFQRLIDQKAPSIQDVDPRAKNSNIETLKDEVNNSPPSVGDSGQPASHGTSSVNKSKLWHAHLVRPSQLPLNLKHTLHRKNWIEKSLIPAINNLHFHHQLNKEIVTRDDNEEVDKDPSYFGVFKSGDLQSTDLIADSFKTVMSAQRSVSFALVMFNDRSLIQQCSLVTMKDIHLTYYVLSSGIFSSSGTPSNLSETMSRFLGAVKKVQLPEFSGFDPQGWLQQANLYFDFNNTSDELRLRLVQFRMVGVAHHWFTAINQIWESITWPEFQSELLQRFGSFELHNPSEQFTTIQQSELISNFIDDVEDTGRPDSIASKAAPSLFRYQHCFGPLTVDGPQVLGQGEPKRAKLICCVHWYSFDLEWVKYGDPGENDELQSGCRMKQGLVLKTICVGFEETTEVTRLSDDVEQMSAWKTMVAADMKTLPMLLCYSMQCMILSLPGFLLMFLKHGARNVKEKKPSSFLKR
ncbi:hypothetical protein E3N88_33208 [Mikania micrantha]|uniref:Retrotransposon gag domain-containing protein n=1 Tax=Mikania micrantha TaxID=192012 RepID=A0A5N6MDA4_9ASTR|nr:hypothetical protein E3N88_33208 [Mikania micrantha]